MALQANPVPSNGIEALPTSKTPEGGGRSLVKETVTATALSIALATNPAMAQVKDYYEKYLAQCTAEASANQNKLRKKIEETIAVEGSESEKVKRLQAGLERIIKSASESCEKNSRNLAQKDAEIAQIDGEIQEKREKIARTEEKIARTEEKIARTEEKIARTEEKIAQTDKDIAQITKIRNGFVVINNELPSINTALQGIIDGSVTSKNREATIQKLESFVTKSLDLLREARLYPSMQTPENLQVLAGIESNVLKIRSAVRGITKK